jgi:hypothetical protein
MRRTVVRNRKNKGKLERLRRVGNTYVELADWDIFRIQPYTLTLKLSTMDRYLKVPFEERMAKRKKEGDQKM